MPGHTGGSPPANRGADKHKEGHGRGTGGAKRPHTGHEKGHRGHTGGAEEAKWRRRHRGMPDGTRRTRAQHTADKRAQQCRSCNSRCSFLIQL